MRPRVLVVPLLAALLLTACGADTNAPTAVSGGAPTTAPTAAGTGAATTAPATDTPAGATDTTPAAGAPAGSGAAIPIGIGVAQTSNVALLGQEEVTGAQIAEKFFNDRGGVNGTPIKLVYQDTGGDEVGANNAFLALMNKDKVVDIVGPT